MLTFLIKAFLWILFLPFKIIFKLLFWWLPTGSDHDYDYYYDDYYWWDKFDR